jgi:hypothetical protein
MLVQEFQLKESSRYKKIEKKPVEVLGHGPLKPGSWK